MINRDFSILVIVFCVLLFVYFVLVTDCDYTVEEKAVPPIIEVVPPIIEVVPDPNYRLPRAVVCSKHRSYHDYSDWDPITETYPSNPAWEKCMGVR